MTLPRSLFAIASFTFLVFLYAHGQISKTILLYEIQRHQKEEKTLQDVHHLLRFQVSRLESSPSLETTLARGRVQLDLPADRHVIRLAQQAEAVGPPKKKTFLDWISATKVAEAHFR